MGSSERAPLQQRKPNSDLKTEVKLITTICKTGKNDDIVFGKCLELVFREASKTVRDILG